MESAAKTIDILLLGSGGREHALLASLQSLLVRANYG